MKPIPDGFEAVHELLVEERMTVDFEGDDPRLGRLHPVYATYWLVKHAELASRKIILPFLEPHEEGIGHEASVRHLAPALPGMRVRVRAVHEGTDVRGSSARVRARILAETEMGDRIAEGATVQVVLPRDRIESNFAALRERWNAWSR